MFLLRWTSLESLERFEDVAYRTFDQSGNYLTRLLQLIVAYAKDGRYSSAAIEHTFQGEVKMFNPLTNDTKVVVTTTSASNAYTRLFTNYNGKKRPENVGYHVLRADSAQHDVSLTDAYV